MEIGDIIKFGELKKELDELVERYFDSLQTHGKTYHGWRLAPKPNTIAILYGFWNDHDYWDQDVHYVTFDELINFGKNGTKN